MSVILPIVELLADCKTDAERAQWLFACPSAVLYREDGSIRAILRKAGLQAGIDYLDVELSAMRAVRGPLGMLAPKIKESLDGATLELATTVGMVRAI